MPVDYPETTATENVSILHPAFPIDKLQRSRRIWVYLPTGYHESQKKYPVIYMHDGQNLFDAHTSYCGEWGVDKVMNSTDDQCIIIGIDNGGLARLTEYNILDHEEHGKGEGLIYIEFIARTLKPLIDKNFRTKKSADDTAMAGSSMGGLITFYAGIYFPEVFGVLGVFSPSFWTNKLLSASLPDLLKKKSHRHQRYFFDVGGKENPYLITQMLEVAQVMKDISRAEITAVVIPEANHDEASWGMAFARFYRWVERDHNLLPSTPDD